MLNRRRFLTESGLLLGAGAFSTAVPARAQEVAQPDFKLLCAPVLTNPAPDAMTVLWATSGPATGWVEYGTTPDLGAKSTGAGGGLMPFDERCFKVRIAGLKPGTRYFYRIHAAQIHFQNAYKITRGAQAVSDVFEFTTPNPAAESTTFTVWNDTHENRETLAALHSAHQAAPGDFLLWNGDQTNDIYTEEKMVGQYLSPAGLPFAAKTPLHYVRGNHDVRGPAARSLPRFTDVPLGEYFYTFRQGPLAGLVLDTGEDKPDDHPVYAGLNDFAAFRSRQAEWLKEAVQRPEFRDTPFKILFCHIPLWWQDERPGWVCLDGRAKWQETLVQAGIRLVVSGHTHQHAYLPATDTRPIAQIVGGGPKPTAATYMRGTVTPKSFKLTMHTLDGTTLETVELSA